VIENRGAPARIIGTISWNKSDPDGYTCCLGQSGADFDQPAV